MEKRCYGCMRPRAENSGPWCIHCGRQETEQNAVHQLPAGTVLQNKYLVGKVLGQGGFGITYLGWDMELKTTVAIKEFYPASQINRAQGGLVVAMDVPGFQEGRERFLKEAQTLARLRGLPHIVQVHNVFAENNTAYIVMEYIEGITLQTHIRNRGGKLTPEETFSLLRPVMQTLAQVHEHGLVHRDISPDNIMLQPDGTVKVLDFGTARDVEAGQLTHSTQAVLKNGFAPVEQYIPGREIDQRADEYALCVTVYYCLTGKVPTGAPERSVGNLPIPWDKIPGLRAGQIAALEKGAALKASDRFADLKELEKALFTPKGSPKIIAGVAALLALVLGIGGWWVWGRSTPAGEEALSVAPVLETTAVTEAPEPTEDTQPQEPMVVDVAMGWYHAVGLKSDGTVVSVGHNEDGQRNVSDWTDIVDIAAGNSHTVGLKADGTMVAVGRNDEGQCDVAEWTDIVGISAGSAYTVGLKSDGTVVAAGKNEWGECNVSGWTDIVAVSACDSNTVGLKSDGTVVGAGYYYDYIDALDVSEWTDIVAVSSGGAHTVGLKADGTILSVGLKDSDQSMMSEWTDIVAVYAVGDYAVGYSVVGLKSDGTVVGTGDVAYDITQWRDIVVVADGNSGTIGLDSNGMAYYVGIYDEGGMFYDPDWMSS